MARRTAARIPTSALAAPLSVLALLVAGCGGSDVPSGAVAKVGGTVITKAEFQHWLDVTARQTASPSDPAPVAVPDPPDYRGCGAALARQAAADGEVTPAPDAMKSSCQRQYETLLPNVMTFLLNAHWVRREARARGVVADPAAIRLKLEGEIQRSFGSRGDFDRFAKRVGLRLRDVTYEAKIEVLADQIQSAVERSVRISNADVAAYYSAHARRFNVPERRDLLEVMARTQADARRAVTALLRGARWSAVARAYSIDADSRSHGGRLAAVARGELDTAFGSAAFAAPSGRLEGPVKTQFGYAVFKVTRVAASSRESLQQARGAVVKLLRGERQQTALKDFMRQYTQKYRGQTSCAKDFAVVAYCKNGRGSAKTAVPSGAIPGSMQAPPGTR